MRAQIGLVRTRGFNGWLIRTVTRSRFNHVVVGISEDLTIGAEPRGARIRLNRERPGTVWSHFDLTSDQRTKIATAARSLSDTPYNYVDDLLIPFVMWLDSKGWKLPAWLRRHISQTRTLQCAQLADLVYENAGITLLHDTLPGAVWPGAFEPIFAKEGWL